MRSIVVVGNIALFAVTASAQTLESTATWTAGVGANGHTFQLYSVPTPGVTWETAQASATALAGVTLPPSPAQKRTHSSTTR